MRQEIEEQCLNHSENIKRIFPKVKDIEALKLCRKLRKFERLGNTITTMNCNGLGDLERNDNSLNRLHKELKEYLGDTDNLIFINGDARGYCFKISDEWIRNNRDKPLYQDFGGYGIIAPEFN